MPSECGALAEIFGTRQNGRHSPTLRTDCAERLSFLSTGLTKEGSPRETWFPWANLCLLSFRKKGGARPAGGQKIPRFHVVEVLRSIPPGTPKACLPPFRQGGLPEPLTSSQNGGRPLVGSRLPPRSVLLRPEGVHWTPAPPTDVMKDVDWVLVKGNLGW